MNEIVNLVKKIHQETKKEQYVSQSNKLIHLLNSNDEIAFAEFMYMHKVSKELFRYLDIEQLYKSLITISNKQLFNFTELLKDRYKATGIGDFLYEDLEVLIKLKKYLDNYLNTKDAIEQPQKYLFESLSNSLMTINDHIEQSKKNSNLSGTDVKS